MNNNKESKDRNKMSLNNDFIAYVSEEYADEFLGYSNTVDKSYLSTYCLNDQADLNHAVDQLTRSSHARVSPPNYIDGYPDVSKVLELSILPNADEHFRLYGYTQGRPFLNKLDEHGCNKIIILAPSYGKQCGIGEYARYLEQCFKSLGKEVYCFRSSIDVLSQGQEFLDGSLLLINHGPGLFDGFNPRLSQGESTTELIQNLNKAGSLGAVPMFLMHSLIDKDHSLLFSRQQMILNSGIPIVTFITSAGTNFFVPSTELGVSPVTISSEASKDPMERSRRDEVIGFFGFFQYGGKDFDALFNLAKELRAKLVGSVATINQAELDKLDWMLDESGIKHELGSGWVEDTELMARLIEADYFYLPQNDYDHWNNSATARFVTNIDRPLFLPPHQPFLDLVDGAIFTSKEDLPRVVAHIREPLQYAKAIERVKAFREKAAMVNTAKSLMEDINASLIKRSYELLIGPNELSLERFLQLDAEAKSDFLRAFNEEGTDINEMLTSGVLKTLFRNVRKIECWRKHYELSDFVQHSVLEAVHTIFFSICKRHISFFELASIVQSVLNGAKSHPSGEAFSLALLCAIDKKRTTFSNPDIALYTAGKVVQPRDITLPALANLIENNIQGTVEANSKKEIYQSYKPYIDNVFELIALPSFEAQNRSFSFDLDNIDIEMVLAKQNLYERFNALLEECSKASISIHDVALMDHPTVREIEENRLSYTVEDFLMFEGDNFVLNLIRSLKKREPFAIEMLTLTDMVRQLSKMALIEYLAAQPCSKAKIRKFWPSNIDVWFMEFNEFVENMRDPISGGIELRNKYLVAARNNQRWWINNNTVKESYFNDAGGNMFVVNSLYYHLTSRRLDYEWPEDLCSSQAQIENWLAPDGKFFNLSDKLKSLMTIKPGDSADIAQISDHQIGNSFHGFHYREPTGIWTNGTCGKIYIRVNTHTDTTGRFRFKTTCRTYGSKHLKRRIFKLTARIIGQDSSQQVFEKKISNDKFMTVSLDLDIERAECIVLLSYEISDLSTPKILDSVEDERFLGVMISNISLEET